MSMRMFLAAAVLAGFAGVMAWADGGKDAAIVPAAKAGSEKEARELARKVDLPQIALAARAELAYEEPKRVVKVQDAGKLDAIRKALVITNDPPSGGIAELNIVFYRGDQAIRTVWVYPYGEWGIVRPGTSYTCGLNERLLDAIKAAEK